MSQINVSDDDKERFDEYKDSDQTQAEAFSEIMDIVDAYNGEPVNHDELAEKAAEQMGPKLELALYRVAAEMNED